MDVALFKCLDSNKESLYTMGSNLYHHCGYENNKLDELKFVHANSSIE